MPTVRPPAHSAFQVRVEIPPEYPPEAASELVKKAESLGKELKRSLGYPTNERLRSSPLVSIADKLKVNKTLVTGEAYDIIDDVYGEDITDDQRRRKLVASRRHKLQKRLIEPYENKPKNSPR